MTATPADSPPHWSESGWFAIALLVVFLAGMSQGLIALTKVTLEEGLDPETARSLWIRFSVAATFAALTGALLLRGILRPGRPDPVGED